MKTRSLIYIICLTFFSSCTKTSDHHSTWSHYLGDPARSHFTTLDQITLDNVNDLEVAWTYESPDTGQMQMNPIMVDGILYGVSAGLKVFALDAGTGKEVWMYIDSDKIRNSTSRGLSYWEDGNDKRILYTIGKDLLALDAKTGQLISSFGDGGKVDLHLGLPEVAQKKSVISNTPGAIYKDLIIMPVRLSEGADAAPGDIRGRPRP